jgi:hypothetical protein
VEGGAGQAGTKPATMAGETPAITIHGLSKQHSSIFTKNAAILLTFSRNVNNLGIISGHSVFFFVDHGGGKWLNVGRCG